MAARFIDPQIWNKPKFLSLTTQEQLIWLGVLTSPHVPDTGLFIPNWRIFTAQFDLKEAILKAAFAKFLDRGWIEWDDEWLMIADFAAIQNRQWKLRAAVKDKLTLLESKTSLAAKVKLTLVQDQTEATPTLSQRSPNVDGNGNGNGLKTEEGSVRGETNSPALPEKPSPGSKAKIAAKQLPSLAELEELIPVGWQFSWQTWRDSTLVPSNKSGEMAENAITPILNRLLWAQLEYKLRDEAMRHGFAVATRNNKPSDGYVMTVAQGWRSEEAQHAEPPTQTILGLGKSRDELDEEYRVLREQEEAAKTPQQRAEERRKLDELLGRGAKA